MDADDVRLARLLLQRLEGPAAEGPTEAVRESLAVQAQDAPLYLDSIAVRADRTSADAVAALASGALVRTHVLRPTWHVVAADDLRWLQALTAPKVLASLAGRHRQLDLDAARLARGLATIEDTLRGGRHLLRSELADALVAASVLTPSPLLGSQVGHLIAVAELQALICSGRPRGGSAREHVYALVDEWVPASDPRPREESLTELVGRFLASHGPVTWRDLQRWTRLTLGEIQGAVADLGDAVASTEVEGVPLWYDVRVMDERGPASQAGREARRRPRRVLLLSVFDEAVLTHSALRFPRLAGHPRGESPAPVNETGGGPVLSDLRDVGSWRRSHTATGFAVTVRLAAGAPAALVADARRAAEALVARSAGGLPATVDVA